MVEHHLNRYFFQVISKTPETLTVKLMENMENCSQFDLIQPDGLVQKVHVRMNALTGDEYGYVKIYYQLWGIPSQTLVKISAKNIVGS